MTTDCFKLPRLAASAKLTKLVAGQLKVDSTWYQGSPRGSAAPGSGNIQVHEGRHSATMNFVTGAAVAREIPPFSSAVQRRESLCDKHLHAHRGACYRAAAGAIRQSVSAYK